MLKIISWTQEEGKRYVVKADLPQLVKNPSHGTPPDPQAHEGAQLRSAESLCQPPPSATDPQPTHSSTRINSLLSYAAEIMLLLVMKHIVELIN